MLYLIEYYYLPRGVVVIIQGKVMVIVEVGDSARRMSSGGRPAAPLPA